MVREATRFARITRSKRVCGKHLLGQSQDLRSASAVPEHDLAIDDDP
jgi:hypothetical protein